MMHLSPSRMYVDVSLPQMRRTRNKAQIHKLFSRSRRGVTTWKVIPKSASNDTGNLLAEALRHGSWRKRPALMIISCRLKISTVQENWHQIAHTLHFTCLHLARIGKPHLLWMANMLARSVTLWNTACDKRLARLIKSNQSRQTLQTVLFCGKQN